MTSTNGRAPRARDVAAAAGVSTATVSRTFNAPDKVAPEARERVLEAARRLGWLPHAAGGALARGRTAIAGFVIPTFDNEVFAVQVGAMQAAFAERDITLLIGCSNYDSDRAATQVEAMLARGVEALAVVGEAQRPGLFDFLDARGVPFVVTYGCRPESPYRRVGFDNRAAYRDITRYLLDLGHRNFGLIFQPEENNDRVAERLAGVREELAERGLSVRPRHARIGRWGVRWGRESLRAILDADGPRPTAIICGNDHLAIGASLEARAMGVEVPGDLSITGFDDVSLAAELDPPLSTTRVDNARIGRTAAGMLLALLDGEAVPDRIEVPPVFIPRGTTARPR